MSKENGFNFIEEKHFKREKLSAKKAQYTASVNTKTGTLTLSMSYIRDNGLEGKFIKLYADSVKKAIAWKILRDVPLATIKEYRRLKVSRQKTTSSEFHQCQLCIKSLIGSLNITNNKSFKKLPINKYENRPVYQDTLHYVELK